MNSEIKILKLLIENKQEIFTIKKISLKTQINYRIVYEKILLLEKEELVKVTIVGKSKICEITNKFSSKIFEAEYERRKEIFKNKDIHIIQKRLSELNLTYVALLFGSYAKKTANKHSDIDLLIIGTNETEVQKTIKLIPKNIHLTQITYNEFISMIKSKEFTVVSEAIRHNIILLGIEEYYRLIKNAGQTKDSGI